LEKAGGIFKNEGLVEKGQAKRAAAGNDDYSGSGNTGGSYGSGNTDSYGSGNTDSYGSGNRNDNNNY